MLLQITPGLLLDLDVVTGINYNLKDKLTYIYTCYKDIQLYQDEVSYKELLDHYLIYLLNSQKNNNNIK